MSILTEEISLSFPRSWMPGDYEYTLICLSDMKLSKTVNKEECLLFVEKEVEYWKDVLEDNQSGITRRMYTEILDIKTKTLDELKKEDAKRVKMFSDLGIDKEDFLKLYYLDEYPNSQKIESVYVIRQKTTDLYKIGVSKSPERRLNEANTFAPFGAELVFYYTGPNAYEREKMIHHHFSKKRVREDGEWFTLDEVDLFSLEKSFELWFEDDKKLISYLGIEDRVLGIKKDSFEKWKPFIRQYV